MHISFSNGTSGQFLGQYWGPFWGENPIEFPPSLGDDLGDVVEGAEFENELSPMVRGQVDLNLDVLCQFMSGTNRIFKVFLGSKVLCGSRYFLLQRFCVLCLEICTPSPLWSANSKIKQAQNLRPNKYFQPCTCMLHSF